MTLRSTFPSIDPELLEGLFEGAAQFRALRPWLYLGDDEVFAVQDPDTKEFAYCVVMGGACSFFGLAAYRGAKGWDFWQKLTTGEISPELDPDILFQQDAMVLEFVSKAELEPQDKKLIAAAKYKAQGSRPYPQFRSHRPGQVPWFFTEPDAKFMSIILGVIYMDLLRRQLYKSNLFKKIPPNKILTYMTKRDKEGNVLMLVKSMTPKKAKEEVFPPVHVDDVRIQRLKGAKQVEQAWEAHAMFLPGQIHDREVPYFPQLALVVDEESGFIFGMEMIPFQGNKAEHLLVALMAAIEKHGIMPKKITVKEEVYFDVLSPIADVLGIDVSIEDDLPAIAQARNSLFEASRTGFQTP